MPVARRCDADDGFLDRVSGLLGEQTEQSDQPPPCDADSTVIILPLQNATAKIRDPWELPYKATGRLGQITAPFERRAPPIPIKALNR